MADFPVHKAKALAVLLLLVFQACSTVSGKKLVENGLTLRYFPAYDIEEVHLQHPVQIKETEVRKHLQSLWYEEMTLSGRKNRVFPDFEVTKIGRLLTKALNHAKPNKIVRFELATSTGVTDVEVFAEKSRIHWRFRSFKGSVFTCVAIQPECLRSNWRLIPGKGQSYFAVQKFLGKENMENWIVEDLNPQNKP